MCGRPRVGQCSLIPSWLNQVGATATHSSNLWTREWCAGSQTCSLTLCVLKIIICDWKHTVYLKRTGNLSSRTRLFWNTTLYNGTQTQPDRLRSWMVQVGRNLILFKNPWNLVQDIKCVNCFYLKQNVNNKIHICLPREKCEFEYISLDHDLIYIFD